MTFGAAKLAICAGGDGDRVGGCDSKEERGIVAGGLRGIYL